MKINILDHQTIDKIAAGEVVERPASVVKELVENAIDSGADAVTVEIRDGGISLIRVTDNGGGIEKSQIRNAFLRHATSKISSADDLTDLVSLGFRGEALASIAAVSMVEAVSKVEEELTGVRYVIEGGTEKELEEVGAPDGTTILVRNLFYNTLPRKKFLKQPQTEGSYVADLMEHLALSHPQISFRFVVNGQNRFHTSGNGDLKEIIYRIYGKDIAKELQEIHAEADGFSIDGFLGRPIINRSNRNYELFYINGRFIKSNLIGKAVEDGYKEYLMQHKFPFCVLHFTIDTKRIDVNVHPAKMEVRIAGGQEFYEQVQGLIYERLHRLEMIPEVTLEKPEKPERPPVIPAPPRVRPSRLPASPEPFEKRRIAREKAEVQRSLLREPPAYAAGKDALKQMELFEDKLLSESAKEQFRIIGQLFDTYWLISCRDKLLIIDQHAAHEKVKYERFIKQFQAHGIVSQNLNPPVVVTLNGREKACLLQNKEHFEALGFVLEEFGGSDYALSGVPLDLYGYQEAGLFYELLDEMAGETFSGTPDSIRIRIASMACKAAVKGNSRMSEAEAEALIDELLSLENPYHCPHGRPTMITMSKYELEKKFKRIVT
ncbi:MAG: DNA mismatch repair endonuclease MutL [Blautia sp.]|nr:DNA mismatch repair endonuclease MutL [Blautia sp.]MCM1200577.1 DNA mismatch repair endonuclease MutL [Bacteroides fragilis]